MIEYITPMYHYTKTESGLNILYEKKIRLNKVGKTNDPKESRPWEPSVTFVKNREELNINEIDEANDVLKNEIPRVVKEEWKVACFTLDGERHLEQPIDDIKSLCRLYIDPGYARPRMWAQYAEDHKGICLSLSKEELDKRLRQKFGEQYFSDEVSYDVKNFSYSNIIFPNDLLADIKALGRKRAAQKFVVDHWKSLFLTKNPDWGSETEYRCLVYSENEFEEISIDGVVKEVWVGMDFPVIYKPSLETFCKELNIRAIRMDWSNGIPRPQNELEIIYEP